MGETVQSGSVIGVGVQILDDSLVETAAVGPDYPQALKTVIEMTRNLSL